MLIQVRDAMFGYAGRAVVGVESLELGAGRCLGVFGPNGAGKTTLIRGITALLPPIRGQVIRNSSAHAKPVRFAYMPQHRAMELHWPMSGLDAAAMATSSRRRFGWVGHSVRGVMEMMKRLDVENLADRPFARLSGGQQQRILLAGAMASEPDVLVLDEPTDGLDVGSTQRLLELLREFTSAGLCTVIISHEVEDLLYICNEVAWLHPAKEAGQLSRVELISPNGLAERMLAARRGGS